MPTPIDIWIASNGKNISFLNEALKSCINLCHKYSFIKIQVSVYCNQSDLNQFLMHPKITFHIQNDNFSQFQHFEWLLQNTIGDDEEWIVFLDDDDLLLDDISEIVESTFDCFLGLLAVGVNKETSKILDEQEDITFKHVSDFLDKEKDYYLTAVDFTGTCVRRRILKEYFNTHKRPDVAFMMEDTILMDYLETFKCGLFEKPVGFKRVKSKPSEWMLQARCVLQQLQARLDSIRKENNLL